jgi:hypothetical protein
MGHTMTTTKGYKAMTQLVATYAFAYGRKGPMDAEAPTVQRGETFTVLPTAQASAADVARVMIRNQMAVTADDWAKRSPKADDSATWAADFCAASQAAYEAAHAGKGKRV